VAKHVTEKLSISLTPWMLAEIDKRDVGRGRSETISRLLRRYVVLVSRPDQQRLVEAAAADNQDQRDTKEGNENG